MSMIRDLETLEKYVNQITFKIKTAHLEVGNLDEEYHVLGEALCQLKEYVLEMYESLDAVADGNLEKVPSNDNPYAGALKQHTANIKHLVWQSKCIADGDYEQHIDFMGELGDSFNVMIKQLEQREQLTEENRKITELLNEQRYETLQREMNSQLTYFNRINEVNESLRSFRHDIKNHFMTLGILLENQEYDDAKKYIDNILDVTLKTRKPLSTGNVVLDALLAEKEHLANKKGIDYTVKMMVSGQLEMNNFDMCVLFGNAIDNAIEACEASASENKKIEIKIVRQGRMVNVVIINTSHKAPKKKGSGELCETTKDNKDIHGIGMKNMENVVNKYNGRLSSSWEDGQFTLKVLFKS